MSATAMTAPDASKNAAVGGTATSSSKQQFKSNANGKSLDNARKQTASPADGQSRKQTQTPQPKAWQGPNPITQRAASHTPNGTEKPLPKLPAKSNGVPQGDKQSTDRLKFLFANFQGLDAVITLRSGEQYTGVFSGTTALERSAEAQYILKMVKRLRSAGQQVNGAGAEDHQYVGEGADHTMSFDVAETIDLDVQNVSAVVASTHQNGSISSGFRTDTEISSRDSFKPRERELQRWQPSAETDVDLSLESAGASGWDQFAANERLYGVQSTYDEDIYTTSIDRSDPRYKQREARAAQIAREIETSAPANAHVAEERTVNADHGDGMDEEEKYSGVIRDAIGLPKRGTNSYVPPSQRPITSTPTVPGAPFDPAIVSMSKQAAAPAPPVSQKSADSINVLSTPTIADASDHVSTSQEAPAAVSTGKKPDSTTEDHVRSTADAFRQFANGEKLRVRQAQEAKRSSARHEKNVKLNDLKKFALNFKLNSRVPDDLVPILAKDREKQMEIQRKAEDAAKEQELKAKDKDKEKDKAVGAVSPIPSNSATAAQTSTANVADARAGLSQHSRARVSQQLRAPIVSAQAQPPRGAALPQRNQMFRGGIPPPQPLPADLRIPTGPADKPSMSPTSATRLNVNAFEFRPSASNFTPAASSPSPQRKPAEPTEAATATFFPKNKTFKASKKIEDFETRFDVIKRLGESVAPDEQKKALASNGGVPQPFRTPPTWPVESANQNTSYKDAFPKAPVVSQGPSPHHTPGGGGSHMPHSHQLPSHMQTAQPSGPSHRSFYNSQLGHTPPFDPRMQQFSGSLQSSPRFPQAQMAFNGHMQPPMQMPQFAGQPMPGYHMSPSMPYRQMQGPGGSPMMMMPGQQQMSQMRGPGYPQAPQFGGPQMGGQMMVHNPSGGYMNGPIPQQQPYSPMPPHAQPHMSHMAHGGPGGYAGSPRPPMMQHSGSHQGFQPNMHMQQQQGPQFAPSLGQTHPYHGQHQPRQLSAGQFPQMTPRQNNAAPQHPSPGATPAGQGDEGK